MIEAIADHSGDYNIEFLEEIPSTALEARSDRELIEAAAVYKLLQHTRAAISELTSRISQFELRSVSASTFEEQTEPLLDQMYEIGWKVASIPASTIEGANAKAQILLDWCEDKRENLIEALAASLCADVQKVFDSR